MPKITFESQDGEEMAVELDSGLSMMEGAVWNDVPGITGLCGGVCACGTCHVEVPEEWYEKLLPMSDPREKEMLEGLDKATPHSRLSCQIRVSAELQGLKVKVIPGD